MTILFDLLPITFSGSSGVYVYAENILAGWYKLGYDNIVVLTSNWLSGELMNKYPNFKQIEVQWPIDKNHKIRCLKMGWRRMKAINASGCDIVFTPIPEHYNFWIPKIPQVSVVHDLQYIRKGNWINSKLHYWQQYKSLQLIAITEFTKSELERLQPKINITKVSVVHNGVGYNLEQYKPILDYPYILDVNMLYEYKNADTLIKAFGLIKDAYDGKLVLVGADLYNRWNTLHSLAESCGVGNRVVHLQNLSKLDLISLYQHASLFVSPSTMEGFGQTPIEAAIYKCPVITTTLTALPESTLGLVNYYEPATDEKALAILMLKILNNPPSIMELEQISNRFRREYDIVSQSEKIYDIIKNVNKSGTE